MRPRSPAGPSPTQARASPARPARSSVVGWLHALALAVAVAVPVVAIGSACGALFGLDGEGWAALGDGRRWAYLLGRTAEVGGLAAAVAVTLGVAAGFLLGRTDVPGRRLWSALLLLGACLPVYIVAVGWFAWLPMAALAGSTLTCGLLHGIVLTPLASLGLTGALRTADASLEEQAALDAPWPVVVRRVTLPQARWAVVVVALLVVLLVATDFTISDLLMVRTFADEVYTQYQLDHRRVGPLLTAVPLLLTLAGTLLAVQRLWPRSGEQNASADRRPPVRLRRWRWVAAVGVGLISGVPLIVPAAGLARHLPAPAALERPIVGVLPALGHSAALAAAGAVLVMLPSLGLAWMLVRGGRGQTATATALAVLLATPAPVVGISLITLLNNDALGPIHDSVAVVVLGYYVRFLAVGVLLVVPAARRVPQDFEDAARCDGCGKWQVQRHVRWPLARRDLAAAALVVFILCFGEIGMTVLVVPPGCDTAAVCAFTLLHSGVYGDLAVLAALSFVAILLPWAGLVWLLSSGGAGTRRPPPLRVHTGTSSCASSSPSC